MMDPIDFDPPSAAGADFCDSVVARFGNSPHEDHQRLCAVLGAMSQELREHSLPRTPLAYFGAICSSLDRLLSSSSTEPHVVSSLLPLLSMLLPAVSPAILRKKREFLSETLIKALQCGSLSPAAAATGLKCVSRVIIAAGADANWADVSQLYAALLRFMTDSTPKVRRQSHLSLRDVLQHFKGKSSLMPASEGISTTFERFLLLAGGSKGDNPEEAKGAQEVLYVLDALKECLPYMSLKSTDAMLKYFKTLLELRKPVVTRRITDSLSILCLDPMSQVSPKGLLDLLCSLAHSVSSGETSVDTLTFTAKLLDSGMRKVYSLNRDVCVVKLPAMVNTLRDILGSEHEEAILAATEAFKNLITACVDDNLVRQGVEQIRTNTEVGGRRSGPTIVERICATVESLLDYQFSTIWDAAFQVVSTTFDKLGSSSAYLMRGTLKSLGDLQKLPDEDFPYRKQLHECVGSALVAMGPETFLSLLPLGLESDDLSEVNVWLFPILKQHTIGAQLSYFTESVLGSMRLIRQKAQKLEKEGRIFSSRGAVALVYSLWSLLPSFCNYAVDTAESFNDLKRPLCTALDEEPDVRGIICSSLELLIEQNKSFIERGEPPSTDIARRERAMSRYNLQVATENLETLTLSAREFFPVMSRIFLKSSKDDGGSLQSAIGAIASIAGRKTVSSLFNNTMKKVLKITEESARSRGAENVRDVQTNGLSKESSPSFARAKLIDLAVSLYPGLTDDEIDVLHKAIQPVLKDKNEGLNQKKAYKALWIILKNREGYRQLKLKELMEFMLKVRDECHFSARRHRLECLYFLIAGSFKDVSDQTRWGTIGFLLADILVALKDANKKTRNRAYDILVEIGHACGDEEKGGSTGNLHKLFDKIAANLTSGESHMISAAAKGLARLTYEFSDLISWAFNLLPSSLHLIQLESREIIKANLGLLKVLVAKSQSDGLQMHLGSIVAGLFKLQDKTKNHFKSKMKVLLEMLIKKCGLDAVKAVMPSQHMKLLTNVRKINERKEKKRTTSSEESKSLHSRATTSRLSRWNHTKIFSDESEEDSDFMDAETVPGKGQKRSSFSLKSKTAASSHYKGVRRGVKSLPEDLPDQLDDEPLDLLDRQKMRSSLKSTNSLKRKAESDDEMEIDPEGRLVIREGGEKPSRKSSSSSELFSDAKSEAAFSQRSVGSSKKGHQKKRKTSESGWAYTGTEYSSKKAKGDVKRKDKLEPYAYWPLDRKMMSRRPEHRAAARKGMASVVRMTKMLEGKSASGALALKARTKMKKTSKKGSKKKAK